MANGEYFTRALSLLFQVFTYSRADTDMAAASFDQKAKSCLDCVLGQPRELIEKKIPIHIVYNFAFFFKLI